MPALWEDRRGLTQKGRERHEPTSPSGRKFHETGNVIEAVRRASTSSAGGGSPPPPSAPSGESSTAARRRSSASSGGLFANLNTAKRGSEDYADRRRSQTEMMASSGRMSGWFNSTFRGITAAQQDDAQKQQQQQQQQPAAAAQLQGTDKRGVME